MLEFGGWQKHVNNPACSKSVNLQNAEVLVLVALVLVALVVISTQQKFLNMWRKALLLKYIGLLIPFLKI